MFFQVQISNNKKMTSHTFTSTSFNNQPHKYKHLVVISGYKSFKLSNKKIYAHNNSIKFTNRCDGTVLALNYDKYGLICSVEVKRSL